MILVENHSTSRINTECCERNCALNLEPVKYIYLIIIYCKTLVLWCYVWHLLCSHSISYRYETVRSITLYLGLCLVVVFTVSVRWGDQYKPVCWHDTRCEYSSSGGNNPEHSLVWCRHCSLVETWCYRGVWFLHLQNRWWMEHFLSKYHHIYTRHCVITFQMAVFFKVPLGQAWLNIYAFPP
jgi:hypothetical protein